MNHKKIVLKIVADDPPFGHLELESDFFFWPKLNVWFLLLQIPSMLSYVVCTCYVSLCVAASACDYVIDYVNAHIWSTTSISKGSFTHENRQTVWKRNRKSSLLVFLPLLFFPLFLFWSDPHNPQAIICRCSVICGKASPSPCRCICTSSLHPAFTL